MNKIITLQKLTKKNFAPFGNVIETKGAKSFFINNGTTKRFDALAIAQTQNKIAISIFRTKPYKKLNITMMERHPLGSQAFVPLQNEKWIVVVAKDKNGTPQTPIAFLANGKQGVQYKKNIWHHPLIALNKTSDFLVVDAKVKTKNLQEKKYNKIYTIK